MTFRSDAYERIYFLIRCNCTTMILMRTYIRDIAQHKGKEITINGWVDVARNQGKMAFFDFRDVTGKVQGVVFGKPEVLEVAKTLRPEWVVAVTGIVNERPEKMVKEGVTNGDVELEITGIEVLNEAETPAFELDMDTREVNEVSRLSNRFIDLRTERMHNNIVMRHRIVRTIRRELGEGKFFEIETPLLTKSTPEGARDYLVPSRLYPGSAYALPQSPQQYKQLLMAGGFENYFQIARCMRDEDLRGDRQPEFTQMDLEMSFVSEEDVMDLNESLLIKLVKEHYPEKTIQEIPFPRIPYAEAMEKYGNDRPDVRTDKDDPNVLAFCWVVDFPFFEKTATSDDPQATGEWTFTHNPFSNTKPEDHDKLMKGEDIESIMAAQYDIVLNGYEIGGGSVRCHDPLKQRKILNILGHSDEKIDENFGHMLKALSSGCPPHGGIAWGLDRLVMILQNEPNIREVIAFPKTREGRDPLMDSPSPASFEQWHELGLKVNKENS